MLTLQLDPFRAASAILVQLSEAPGKFAARVVVPPKRADVLLAMDGQDLAGGWTQLLLAVWDPSFERVVLETLRDGVNPIRLTRAVVVPPGWWYGVQSDTFGVPQVSFSALVLRVELPD